MQERPPRSTSPVESKFPRKGSLRRLGLEEPEPTSSMMELQEADEVEQNNRESMLSTGNTNRARIPKQGILCPWRRQRRQRKPPSNPPGWSEGKSSVYDVAQHPNRIVVINGDQVTNQTAIEAGRTMAVESSCYQERRLESHRCDAQ